MNFGFLFDSTSNPEGDIGYYKLKDWWLSAFTKDERSHMVKVYQPLGGSENCLVKGKIESCSNNSTLSFLSNLSGWFDNPRDRNFARKIISKAKDFEKDEKDILNLHFFYQAEMNLFYKDRDNNPDSLQKTIDSALSQIKIAGEVAARFKKEYPDSQLPGHEGYIQLCIILDKQGKMNEAIKYAKQAKSQDWSGDWDNRIARYQKKIDKLQQK